MLLGLFKWFKSTGFFEKADLCDSDTHNFEKIILSFSSNLLSMGCSSPYDIICFIDLIEFILLSEKCLQNSKVSIRIL